MLDALFERGRLTHTEHRQFRLVLRGTEYVNITKYKNQPHSYSPKQVALRWGSFLNPLQSDFAATFSIKGNVDVVAMRMTQEPEYISKSDRLVFMFSPFNRDNKQVLVDLSNKKWEGVNLFSSAPQVKIPNDLRKDYMRILATPISDGAEWHMKPVDAYFTGLTPDDIYDWRQRNSPFLLSNSQWNSFIGDLYSALKSDGFGAPLDIRLNGSAARLFSNPTKGVPGSARDAILLYEKETNSAISQDKAKDIITSYDQWLGAESQRDPNDIPRYRTVDLMTSLGIGDRSDIDLQITSDSIAKKVRRIASNEGVSPDKVKHQVYGFYNKELVAEALPNTSLVMQKWSSDASIGIDFTYALFDGVGPLNSIAHFRNSDWVVATPNSSGFDSPVWYSSQWSG